MAPGQGAASLTEWVFVDETHAGRAELMSQVEPAAIEFRIRGSMLGGSADAEELVTHLFSRFSASKKALQSHISSCRDWLASRRCRQP